MYSEERQPVAFASCLCRSFVRGFPPHPEPAVIARRKRFLYFRNLQPPARLAPPIAGSVSGSIMIFSESKFFPRKNLSKCDARWVNDAPRHVSAREASFLGSLNGGKVALCSNLGTRSWNLGLLGKIGRAMSHGRTTAKASCSAVWSLEIVLRRYRLDKAR